MVKSGPDSARSAISTTSTRSIMPVSLNNFDENARKVKFSPRSVDAIESLGFKPKELLKVSTLRGGAKVLDGIDDQEDAFARRRREHLEVRRAAKIAQCQERYQQNLARGNSRPTSSTSRSMDNDEKVVALIAVEKMRERKMKERQKKELQALLMYEIRLQKLENNHRRNIEMQHAKEKDEEKQRIESRREWEKQKKRQEEMKRKTQSEEQKEVERLAAKEYEENIRLSKKEQAEVEERRKHAASREQQRIKRALDRQEALERKERHRQAEISAKEAEMQRQERVRLENLAKARAEQKRLAMIQRKKQKERFSMTLRMQEQILTSKKNEFLRRQELAEQRQQEFDQERERQRLDAKERAREKMKQIKRAQAHADYLLSLKIEKTEKREAEIQKRLAEREAFIKEEKERAKKTLSEQQKRRLNVYKHNNKLMEERIARIQDKRAKVDARNASHKSKMKEKSDERLFEERMLLEDRKEHVRRMQNIKEYERKKSIAKFDEDQRRIEKMRTERKTLQAKRRHLRSQVEFRRKIMIEEFDSFKSKLNLDSVDATAIDFRELKGLPPTLASLLQLPDYEEERAHSPLRIKAASSSSAATTGKKKKQLSKESKDAQSASQLLLPSVRSTNQTSTDPHSITTNINSKQLSKSQSSVTLMNNNSTTPTNSTYNNNHFNHTSTPQTRTMSRPHSTASLRYHTPSKRSTKNRNRRGRRSSGGSVSRSRMRRSSSKKKKKRGSSNSSRRPYSTHHDGSQNHPRYGHSGAFTMSLEEAELVVEELAAEQNTSLLVLLEKEQKNEAERERIYTGCTDEGERKRLGKIFSTERAKASEIIKAISREHETTLALKMEELGLLDNSNNAASSQPGQSIPASQNDTFLYSAPALNK